MASTLSAVIKRFDPGDLDIVAFLKFRKSLFIDKLGWDLRAQGEVEMDEFDNENAVFCIVFRDGDVVGGFRAIQASNPYLARNVFASFASSQAYPTRPDYWEISRFGVMTDRDASLVARANYSVMFRFALKRQATALIAIADLAYERYLATLGIVTARYGQSEIIGHDRTGRPIEIVAGEIPLTGQASPRFLTLLSIANTMEINDETLVLGSDAISA
jgi:acyl homoserine lactone synthase